MSRTGMAATAIVLCIALSAAGQSVEKISGPAAHEDIVQLGSLLERVHPDPYSGFGGRVAFQREIYSLVRRVERDSIRITEFRQLLAGFLARMEDGHTGMSGLAQSGDDVPDLHLPLEFSTCSDGIFVSDAAAGFDHLTGALVVAVNGTPTDAVALETRVLLPSENLPGSRRRLASRLGSLKHMRVISAEVDTSLRLSVRYPDTGVTEEVVLDYSVPSEPPGDGSSSSGNTGRIEDASGPFEHRLLNEGRIGYLKLKAMWSREAFESMRASGRADIRQWLDYAYEHFLGISPDPDPDKAIDAFPSLIEEVANMYARLEAAGAREVIIDLRQNGGGFSVIGEPLLYQLFGDEYLQSPSPVYFATRVSDEMLAIQGRTLEEISDSEGREIRMGDLIFNPREQEPRAVRTKAEFLDEQARLGFAATALLTPPAQPLSVVAVVDAGTFSAAFDLAYHLFRMGATLFGTSPSQSPKAFTDSTPFELENSGLTGSVSRSAVVYPGIPSEAGAVILDIPVSWDVLRRFDFHPDTPVLVAVEHLTSRR